MLPSFILGDLALCWFLFFLTFFSTCLPISALFVYRPARCSFACYSQTRRKDESSVNDSME